MNTYYVCGFPITDSLNHSGIPGMKWGVRRYQNPDGTLTPAGKERYYGSPKTQSKLSKAAGNVGGVIKRTAARYVNHVKLSIKKRHPWLMSDEELNSVVNRMNMEKKMRDLKKDEDSSKLVNRIIKDTGDIALNNARNFGQNFSSTSGRLIAENMFKREKGDKNKKKNKGNDNGGNNSNNGNGGKQNKNNKQGNSNGSGTTYIYNIYNGKAPKNKK